MALSLGLGIGLTRGQGGGFDLRGYLSSLSDGFFYDYTDASTLSQDTAGATPVTAIDDVIGRALDRRSGPNSPRNATQATSGARPRWQGTAGARFDALDDNHLTTVNTPVGPYFIAANVFVPASLPGGQVIAGQRATANERLFLAVESAGGRAGGGVGQQSFGTIVGGPDLRGRTVTIGIAANGSQVRLYADGALVYQDAQVGTWAATTPLRIGALNDAGTAGIFFSGDVRRICGGTDYPDLARFNQIAATLGA